MQTSSIGVYMKLQKCSNADARSLDYFIVNKVLTYMEKCKIGMIIVTLWGVVWAVWGDVVWGVLSIYSCSCFKFKTCVFMSPNCNVLNTTC